MTKKILFQIAVVLLMILVSLAIARVAKACPPGCETSETGLALIRTFEGYMPFVYKDAVGIPTIGYGHVLLPGETFQQPLLPAQADALLKKDARKFEKAVKRRVRVSLAQHQFDALVSFTFNLGETALAKSTLLRRVNEARHSAVPDQFMRWVYAGGRKLRGLVLRRAAEAKMYAG